MIRVPSDAAIGACRSFFPWPPLIEINAAEAPTPCVSLSFNSLSFLLFVDCSHSISAYCCPYDPHSSVQYSSNFLAWHKICSKMDSFRSSSRRPRAAVRTFPFLCEYAGARLPRITMGPSASFGLVGSMKPWTDRDQNLCSFITK